MKIVYGMADAQRLPLADESVDAIICDPPYELGFMGRAWDATGVAYSVDTWREALRVLKPGGHLLAFGGARTAHRVTVGIEDAGFDIRDTITWLYGCLDDQTEILVDGGWERYQNVKQGAHALGYDVERDEFSWQPIERVVVYPHSNTAYRLVGDHTDQLVTREHRCIVERGGKYVFETAEEAARQREARVPVLENVQHLLDALPLPHPRTGSPEQGVLEDVRGSVCECREQRTPQPTRERAADVSGVREDVPAVTDEAAGGSRPGVLAEVSRDTGCGPAQGHGGVGPVRLVSGNGIGAGGQDDRPEQPRLERRGDVLSQEGQLQAGQVRPMPCRVCGDVPQGRVRDGAPATGGADDRAIVDATRSGASRGPRPAEQRDHESVPVQDEPGPQAVRGARFTTSDLVRVEPEHYNGIVWCVTVRTGAFVARRNGKVFVTGNSGFPKSLDVSKAIDKAAGATREVVGINRRAAQQTPKADATSLGRFAGTSPDLTAPATDAARQWAGWGTALKPASEPIIVARKPLSGTVAQTVLAHGTGALNIDACRVSASGRPLREKRLGPDTDGTATYGAGLSPASRAAGTTDTGRWPANVVLSHLPTCMTSKPAGDEIVHHCADGCPVAELDAQSGVRPAGSTVSGKEPSRTGTSGVYGVYERVGFTGHGDTGGASRFFPTFRYQAKAPSRERPKVDGYAHPTVKPLDLMRWLVRLVAPPGGVVLDMFAGSGTTVEACLLEGVACYGFDKDPANMALIRERVQRSRPTEEVPTPDTPKSSPRPAAADAAHVQPDLFTISFD